MDTGGPPRPPARAALRQLPGLLALAALFLWQASYYWHAVIDDAYISLRFADMVASGHGFVFNEGGPRVEGFTNFLWVVAMVPVLWLGGDAMFWAKLLGLACALGTMAVAWRFAALLRGREDALNLAAPAFLAVNASFAHWALMGLETPLAALLVCATYWRAVREFDDRRALLASPVLAVLAAMTRIDALYFMSPLAGYMAWLLARDRTLWRRVGAWALLAAIPFAAYYGWKVAYFGDWLPNTYYAKQRLVDIRADRPMGLSHLGHFFLRQTPPVPAPGAGAAATAGWLLRGGPAPSFWWFNWWLLSALALLAQPRAARLLLLAPTALLAYYLWHVDGDWMPNFRFQQVALPFLAVAGAVALGAALEEAVRARRWLAGPVAGLGVLALAGVAQEQFRFGYLYIFGPDPIDMPREAGWWRAAFVRERLAEGFHGPLNEVSEHLLLHTRDGAAIFMSDIGQPLWFARHLSLLDGCGLCDPYLGHAPSVRGDLPTAEELYARQLRDWGRTEEQLSGAERDFARASAKRREFEAHLSRNCEYVLGEARPEYLLIFLQHDDGDPARAAYPYPEIAARIHESPLRRDNYRFLWRAPKTDRVWNTLYARSDVPEGVPDAVRAARLEEAMRRNPRMFSLVSLAVGELRRMTDARAAARLRTAVGERTPRILRSRRATVELAYASHEAGDHGFAARLLAQATESRPRDWELWQLRADAHWRADERPPAIESLRLAASIAPKDQAPALRAILAGYLETEGDQDGALDELLRAAEAFPHDPRLWGNLAATTHRFAAAPEIDRARRELLVRRALDAYRRQVALLPEPLRAAPAARIAELERQAEWLGKLRAESEARD
ncbi:MAG: hypothetical protein SF028_05040 [Candidatus Sumerlaeia bacterium]|nr:hypothetical protein [Candidatus Sumerlaeia bacterium]